ncbi:hypothetical protein F8M41_009846 [Gigaspora margarita]|uniref:Uncharacterized protein n=1 Tax=Gigaspora margarita TaxID=4874 RepID=A0A8H4AUQ2_GIGMA|nr:hypothetical protein F8M41_009846 [Gigaspora margarita]
MVIIIPKRWNHHNSEIWNHNNSERWDHHNYERWKDGITERWDHHNYERYNNPKDVQKMESSYGNFQKCVNSDFHIHMWEIGESGNLD